jgi:hypothetical protein
MISVHRLPKPNNMHSIQQEDKRCKVAKLLSDYERK